MEFEQVLQTIAKESGAAHDELNDETVFADLGVDDILTRSIISSIAKDTGLRLSKTVLQDYPTVSSLRAHLSGPVKRHQHRIVRPTPRASKTPLSIVLQGKLSTAAAIIFLLPDGGGSAAAYLRLPTIGPDVCVVGLNSPYLNSTEELGFSIDEISALWADEIKKQQPKGPYILGGWSAGGYYSFEVAKYLGRQGEVVEKLILIDSPCRLFYEELPMQVVRYLAANNLMGNWGAKQAPSWMINHFDLTIRAIAGYMPTPQKSGEVSEVCIIWAADGVLKEGTVVGSELDLTVKVSRKLLFRPKVDMADGWDLLFPNTKISVAEMSGNHFTLVYPPHCQMLSDLLGDAVRDASHRMCHWDTK